MKTLNKIMYWETKIFESYNMVFKRTEGVISHINNKL